MFPFQYLRNLASHPADSLVLGIYQVPCSLQSLPWKRHCQDIVVYKNDAVMEQAFTN